MINESDRQQAKLDFEIFRAKLQKLDQELSSRILEKQQQERDAVEKLRDYLATLPLKPAQRGAIMRQFEAAQSGSRYLKVINAQIRQSLEELLHLLN